MVGCFDKGLRAERLEAHEADENEEEDGTSSRPGRSAGEDSSGAESGEDFGDEVLGASSVER